MAVTDKATHTVKCICGASESVTLFEYGSAYGGSWQSGTPMTQFTVTWSAGGFGGPSITSTKCNKCGDTPEITIS